MSFMLRNLLQTFQEDVGAFCSCVLCNKWYLRLQLLLSSHEHYANTLPLLREQSGMTIKLHFPFRNLFFYQLNESPKVGCLHCYSCTASWTPAGWAEGHIHTTCTQHWKPCYQSLWKQMEKYTIFWSLLCNRDLLLKQLIHFQSSCLFPDCESHTVISITVKTCDLSSAARKYEIVHDYLIRAPTWWQKMKKKSSNAKNNFTHHTSKDTESGQRKISLNLTNKWAVCIMCQQQRTCKTHLLDGLGYSVSRQWWLRLFLGTEVL